MTAQDRARRLGGTFGHLFLATPNLSGDERLRMAGYLSEERWADGWARVAEQLEGERQGEGVLAFRSRRRPQLNPGARRIESTIGLGRVGDASEDILLAIPASEYFAALAGIEVPATGATVNCPCPAHADRSPSCRVYPGDRGWNCFGCGRGGTIFDLARELSGIGDRGAEFRELRTWITERVNGVGVAT